ncbi:ubiquitin thioesterase otulin [Nematolebias whitei]|uniref:ubiquitin thioesterase otulin n=1 Tax=Nematolebias whitei TaxID=451745 RepID=UPI00189B6789|nr:ubiquitin thioesterase otulin [Nematolebias whitei]
MNAVTVGLDNSGSPCKDSPVEKKGSQSIPSGLESTGLDLSEKTLDCESSDKTTEATSPADAKNSLTFDMDEKPSPECSGAEDLKEIMSSEKTKRDAVEETVLIEQDKDVPKIKEDDGLKKEEEAAQTETETPPEEDPESQEETEITNKQASDGEASDGTGTEENDSQGNSEEDLYRGAEQLSPSQILEVEDNCSLSPAVDILSYSKREWKGNTAKSALIKKGYKEMSQKFDGVRRVRGDNYCALRATLFQVLSQSTAVPVWLQEDNVIMLPEQLEAQEGLVSQWRFPGVCVQQDGSGGDATQQLKGYVERLRNTWQAAVDCPSSVERQKLCERVFQGGEEELGLLEALKLLMLGQAVELHSCMLGGGDVPLFCWLLFARDSSDCPRSFLFNHLRHVGLSAGLEQVEMFLLGYTLQHTIQVYRLYQANTEEFITFYPDDHKDDWPSVCLVTEDDRHYNVPVVDAGEPKELASS